jgi:hypothetical protein
VLSYQFAGNIGDVEEVLGDVVLLEGDGSSDVITFYQFISSAQVGQPQLLFYSDNSDGVDALADTGLPGGLSSNVVRITEVGPEGNNGAFYTPTANQPGYISGYAVTYHFISDATSVPEPATWATMLLGFGAVGASMRWRRRSRPIAA